jgi:uncharacterized protein YndB with AHSA1/START domain
LSAPLPGAITTEHCYPLPIGADAMWQLISDMGAYRGWWVWLRRFEAAGLVAGETWRCEVQPPLPYLVRFGVTIEEVEAPRFIRATVTGDVVGTATLRIEGDGADDRCVATLGSTLAPGNALLRLVSRLTPPVARFGHDWVLDSGARQFIARAITPMVPGPDAIA